VTAGGIVPFGDGEAVGVAGGGCAILFSNCVAVVCGNGEAGGGVCDGRAVPSGDGGAVICGDSRAVGVRDR
jgi:hypothetical protein